MGLVSNFFGKLVGASAPQAQAATVSATATGSLYTLTRLLGSSSTFALISGSNSNLAVSGASVVATAAIGAGTSQTAIVREASGQIAVEYPVTLTGAGSTPTPTPTPAATYIPAGSSTRLIYSLYKLPGSDSDPVAQLSRASDSSTLEIYAGSDGQTPDMSGLAAFGSSTTVYCLRYDQGPGKTGLEVQATKAQRPILLQSPNQYGLWSTFTGTNSLASGAVTNQFTTIPASYATSRNNATLINVSSGVGGPGRMGLGTTSGVTNDLSLITNSGACLLGNAFGSSNYATPVDPSVIIAVSGATATVRVDGRKKTVTAASAASLTGGAMYQSAVNYAAGLTMNTYANIFEPTALTAADEVAMASALKSIFAVPTYTDQVVFVGDSICFSQGSFTGRSTATRFSPNASRRVSISNLGVPGSLFGAANNNPDAYYDATGFTGKQIAITNAGTNDLGGSGASNQAGDTATSGTLIYLANNWIAARKAKGFIVVMQTLLPRYGTWTSAQETERLKYNQWLRDNASALGFTCADIANINQFQTNNATYFVDGLHPTDAGYALIEQFLRSILNGLLG